MMASCLRGGLVDGLRVMLGNRVAKPMNTCVLLMAAVFWRVSIKTLSMAKLKRLRVIMWSMTFSCSMMFGAQVIVVRLEGKEVEF